jgi:hypothetical protein
MPALRNEAAARIFSAPPIVGKCAKLIPAWANACSAASLS